MQMQHTHTAHTRHTHTPAHVIAGTRNFFNLGVFGIWQMKVIYSFNMHIPEEARMRGCEETGEACAGVRLVLILMSSV